MKHNHKFVETASDEIGRRFGYCQLCEQDMQDLGNGMHVYQSHKRARIEAEARLAAINVPKT